MYKYMEGISEKEKVRNFLDKIHTTNQKLESAITFCRYNHNGNYLAATKYLATKIRFIFPEQQPSQQKHHDHNKQNMSHVKNDKFGKTKSRNEFGISDTARFFSSERWSKINNNPGVLKIIQDCPRHKKKADGSKRRKFGNSNRA